MHDFVCGSPTPRWPAKAADRSRVETSERRVKEDNMVGEKDKLTQ